MSDRGETNDSGAEHERDGATLQELFVEATDQTVVTDSQETGTEKDVIDQTDDETERRSESVSKTVRHEALVEAYDDHEPAQNAE